MLTQSEIFAQADLYMLAMRLDEFHRMAYVEGATWANNQNSAEVDKLHEKAGEVITRLRVESSELLYALQLLYDEQNGAPLETRRAEWQKAMDAAQIALEKYDRTT